MRASPRATVLLLLFTQAARTTRAFRHHSRVRTAHRRVSRLPPLHSSTAAPAPEPALVKLRSKRQIAAFGLPISFLFLSNFALGAVDTAAVARCGGLLDLAALAPGTAAMEYSCYVLSALTSIIFNRLASVPLDGPVDDPSSRPRRDFWDAELSPGLGLAALVGLAHAAVFLACAESIALLCGAPPALSGRAALYLRWRALGAATFQYQSVSSSAFYATKDSATPFRATAVAVVVNVVGDALLCPRWGLAGAAAATSAAQVSSCAYLRRRLVKAGLAPQSGSPVVVPSRAKARELLTETLPHGVVCASRTAFYFLLGRWCCQLGVVASAAQQITSTVFWGSSSASAEPMSVAAQTFVPEQTVLIRAAAANNNNNNNGDGNADDDDGSTRRGVATAVSRLVTVLRRLFVVSLLWGAGVTGVVWAVLRPGFVARLSPNPAVSAEIPRLPLYVISLTIAPMLLSEGAMLGKAGNC